MARVIQAAHNYVAYGLVLQLTLILLETFGSIEV